VSAAGQLVSASYPSTRLLGAEKFGVSYLSLTEPGGGTGGFVSFILPTT
jgi:hypothetical protein